MRPAGRPSIGQLAYLVALIGGHGRFQLSRGVYGCLRPAPHVELHKDASDVVLHGLAAEVQPRRDLGIRQPHIEQCEDLALTLTQQTDALRTRTGSLHAE